MADPVDVPAAVPAAEEPTPTPDATADVTASTEVVEDRPLKNLQAEFNRKLGRVEQQYQELAAMLQQALQPKPAAPPASTLDQYTNEQLAQLAQAGSADAQTELTKRLVQAQVTAATVQQQYAQRVQSEHQALYRRYPVLNDPTHPLTQYAMQAKAALLRQGYQNALATDLEAIKTAIVDNAGNPAVLGGAQAMEEPTRRAGVQAQTQIDGGTVRRQSNAPAKNAPALSQRELDLAKRMGLTEEQAKGSKARFEKRQAEGRSSLGAVALHVREG